jgi:hypothetical protein
MKKKESTLRNLALGLITNFQDLIVETAKLVQNCPIDPESPIDPCRKIALEELQPFRNELRLYPTYRLAKLDAIAFTSAVSQILSPHDSKFENGQLDTRMGNESLTVQMGTILASLVASQRMLWDIRRHSEPIALYIHQIYDLFCVDPGDPRIEEITRQFLAKNPIDGNMANSLLQEMTSQFVAEIEQIPEDENYLARHIFLTGFVTYPGIGYQLQLIELK